MIEKNNVIYKITNPKGKCYIGLSSNFTQRYNDYKYLDCKRQIKLYRSFCKYGFENHWFEIIESQITDDKLHALETKYIEAYNTFKNGLNCTLGGDVSPAKDLAVRKKLSLQKLGKKNPMFGKTTSNETKKKISLALIRPQRVGRRQAQISSMPKYWRNF